MEKRGKMLLREIIGIIIALVLIFSVFYYLFSVFSGFFFGKQEKLQAQGQLSQLVNTLNNIDVGESKSFLLYAPQNWWLVSFFSDVASNKINAPVGCWKKDCICICEKANNCEKEKICEIIEKPLEKNNEQVKLKIELSNLKILNKEQVYEIIGIETATLKPKKLTKSMKSRLERCEIAFKDYEEFIREASLEHKIEEAKIKAVICQESEGNSKAISWVGAAGLMQLMPQTAKGLDLKNTIYPTEIIVKDSKEYTVSVCRKGNEGKCNYESDERFDPEKNIMAGTEHMKDLEKEFSSFELVLAAYNWGSANLKRNCPDLDLTTCELPEETENYVPAVLAYYGKFT